MTKTVKVQLGAAMAAMALISGMIFRMSTAAFTATTENAGNNWEAGRVTLTDNDGGNALFTTASDGVLKPGQTITTKCIQVSYTGTITPSAAVKLAVSSLTDTDGSGGVDSGAAATLSDDLDVVVDIGAAGSDCTLFTLGANVYTGTLAGLTTAVNTWTPVLNSDTMRPFQFKVTLGADTANDAQGDKSAATLTWSATS